MALIGTRVVEFAGLAPGPFAGLILADHGATVTRIDRKNGPPPPVEDILCRGKRSISVDLKTKCGYQILRKLIAQADVLIDPFRPGVLEKLGLGPDVFLGHGGLNRSLIYARVVGFSSTGPHKDMAGHDINYLALSGVLSMLPGNGKPGFPMNILADFAGGGQMCATGILLALVERGRTGRGQVVTTDMVSGARYVSSYPLLHTAFPTSRVFSRSPGNNLLDGGAPFYDVYECCGGQWMSVGCIEPQFFAEFIRRFNAALPAPRSGEWRPSAKDQLDREGWPKLRDYLKRGFLTKTREEWADVFHGTDSCATPVLTPNEAAQFDSQHSVIPTPQPQLSRTPATVPASRGGSESLRLSSGTHTKEILIEMGYSATEILRFILEGAVDGDIMDDIAKL